MTDKKRTKILMTQQEIADAIGRSQSAIHYILNGDRMPSVDMAVRLEDATGICREAWVWPERHYNPYIPFQGLSSCLTCSNRARRTRKLIDVCIDHFSKAKDKKAAFIHINRIEQIFNGMSGVVFLWREIRDDGLYSLAHSGHPTMPALKRMAPTDFPRIWGLAQAQGTLALEHVPYGLDDSWKKEIAMFSTYQIRSTRIIARGNLMWASYSVKTPMMWRPEILVQLGDALQSINDIWLQSQNRSCATH